MSQSTLRGQVVLEYLKKYPDIPNLQLARIIYRDNIELFNNQEAVRTCIRYYKGADGNKNRKKLKTRNYVRNFRIVEKVQYS